MERSSLAKTESWSGCKKQGAFKFDNNQIAILNY